MAYNRFQLLARYLKYRLSAANGKGHAVHSPFVFDFITRVLNDRRVYADYEPIERLRSHLLRDKTIVSVEDAGAGSARTQAAARRVCDIAKWSLQRAKYAQLLYRIVRYYRLHTILELGTSLGITTCYLARANPSAAVYSFEGADALADRAARQFAQLPATNIQLIRGHFDERLPVVLRGIDRADLAFVDGNHRKAPTIAYFRVLIDKAADETILIFDDIHWSSDMEESWALIKADPAVTMTIDLFFFGIVFFRKSFRNKQHFILKY